MSDRLSRYRVPSPIARTENLFNSLATSRRKLKPGWARDIPPSLRVKH